MMMMMMMMRFQADGQTDEQTDGHRNTVYSIPTGCPYRGSRVAVEGHWIKGIPLSVVIRDY